MKSKTPTPRRDPRSPKEKQKPVLIRLERSLYETIFGLAAAAERSFTAEVVEALKIYAESKKTVDD